MFVDIACGAAPRLGLLLEPCSFSDAGVEMSTAWMYPALRVAAVAALLSPIAATPLLAQCSQADKAALEAFDKSWGDATVSGDRSRMTPFLSEGFMTVNVAGT